MSGPPAKTPNRILFVTPYPAGRAASQRFRFEQFMPALDAAGIAHDSDSFWDEEAWRVLYVPGQQWAKAFGLLRGVIGRFLLLFTLAKYDVVFVHREAAPLGPPLFEWIVAKLFDKPLIYDFDDAIWLPNASEVNPGLDALRMHGKVADICSWSRRVLCGNSYLADYASRYADDVVVFPTVLDTGRHEPQQNNNEPVVIGWTGSHSTVSYIEPIVPALEALAERVAFRFRLIADREPDFAVPNLEFVRWRKETEIEDLAAIDIGVMPIPDTEWARGKCGLKILQYMAMGMPSVSSPVGVNRDIVDDGVDGYLAVSTEDWVERLAALAADTRARREMGSRAREKAVAGYSVAANTEKFLAAVRDL